MNAWARFNVWFESRALWSHASFLYAVVLLIVVTTYLATWPIQMLDTDLWYHLNSGRYILTHHQLPQESYFSFLEPRPWIDYFWLFQVVVYQVYTWAGYLGLVALRALLFAAIGVTLLALLFTVSDRAQLRHTPWMAFVFVCAITVLLPRAFNLRPHLFTYLCITLMLYILECRPHQAWWLPGLAVLWVNFQGIAYPMLWLISGSYLLQALYRGWRRQAPRWWSRKVGSAALACFPAVLLTPHGARLLPLPFTPTTLGSEYIAEMRPMDLFEVLSAHIVALAPSSMVFFSLLAGAIGLAAVLLLTRRREQFAPLLLCLGGWYLLSKGGRFVNEFFLLSLPLLRAHPLSFLPGVMRRVPKPVYFGLVVGLMLMPLRYVMETFRHRPAFPFSSVGLPVGTATMLQAYGQSSRVLNEPNIGGYLQWMLYPKHRIYIDMEAIVLFSDEDLFAAGSVFSDPQVLGWALARYRPDFLLVPLQVEGFPDRIKHWPAYELVWCDDGGALYADRQRHPTWQPLAAYDPFRLAKEGVEAVLKDPEVKAAAWLEEAERLIRPGMSYGMGRHVAAALRLAQGDAPRVLEYAQALIHDFPYLRTGYELRGDAFRALGQLEAASAAYELALSDHVGQATTSLLQHFAMVLSAQGKYAQAYQRLRTATPLYGGETSAEDLYRMAVTAFLAGKPDEARRLFRYLYRYRMPLDDSAWARRVRQRLEALGLGFDPLPDPGNTDR
jgi:tetratricopeptide (TPR) repeat protein